MSLHKQTKYPVVDADPSFSKCMLNLTPSEFIQIPVISGTFASIGYFTGTNCGKHHVLSCRCSLVTEKATRICCSVDVK